MEVILSNSLAHADTLSYLPRTLSKCFLNNSKEWDTTTSLDNAQIHIHPLRSAHLFLLPINWLSAMESTDLSCPDSKTPLQHPTSAKASSHRKKCKSWHLCFCWQTQKETFTYVSPIIIFNMRRLIYLPILLQHHKNFPPSPFAHLKTLTLIGDTGEAVGHL